MLCQICNMRIATRFVKVNGRDTDVCETCAIKVNLLSPFYDFFDMDNYMDDGREERVCPNCGLSESKLEDGYKFGCSTCYEVFADKADEYFRRLHGVEYRGKFATKDGYTRRPRYLKDATIDDIPHLYKMLENPSIKADTAKVNLIVNKIKELKGER
ncbi:MAG: hypothetical protein K2G37_04830 [Clostridia bacterium]|nr:hypothetical protein [Clostridia bacterium]MDE7329338.1 hypothetical protein [Clostridia bacterium]